MTTSNVKSTITKIVSLDNSLIQGSKRNSTISQLIEQVVDMAVTSYQISTTATLEVCLHNAINTALQDAYLMDIEITYIIYKSYEKIKDRI